MYLSYESKQKIDSIALKIAHLDVDPIFFLEAYMQYKAPVVLNEQELTNWWQNIKNYVKGGADAYYAGQVDIKRKYEEAKQGLNAIVNLLKAGPYKDKLDPAMEKQLIDHLEDVVGELGRADQHVDKLNDRIRQSHKEKKMYGKDVAHARSLPDNFFDDLFIIDSAPSRQQVVSWVQTKPAEQQKMILDSAKLEQRRISRKIYAYVDSIPDAELTGLVAGGVITDADKKLVMSYLLAMYAKNTLQPMIQIILTGVPPFNNDIKAFVSSLPNFIKNLSPAKITQILQEPIVQGNKLNTDANTLKGYTEFTNVYNNADVKPKFASSASPEDAFAKLVVFIHGILSIAPKLV